VPPQNFIEKNMTIAQEQTPIDTLPKIWNPEFRIGDMLRGKRGLVVGVANENSIAFGCAAKLRAFGADLALTYLNEKSERYVRPLADQLQAQAIAAA
jgi:enoyl-[acyl-carrier protein] reductase I